MPRRNDIRKVMIIGSGPIVIGQACEFDYSGTQACRALRGSRGISASLVGQILVEESVLGWEELEREVVRDSKNQMITVCFIENVDAIRVIGGTNIRFARWAFEKFRGAEDNLGTQMRAVDEVMSIGKTYKEALQESIRSLENGRYGLGFARDFHRKPLAKLMDMGGTASRRSPCKNCTKGARTSWTSSRTGRFT